ncbi:molybdate ABC transporter substrate-binding protein [Microcoleus sp. F8-D3]
MNRRVIAFLSCLFIAFILSVGLKIFAFFPANAQSRTLLIAVAASLQNAIEEIDPFFEKANSGVAVNYNFAASGPLQQQIEQGAPVDVFISAATTQMDTLQNKNLILTDTRRNLLTNNLVLIVPGNSTLGITNFRQLINSNVKRIFIGEPRSVPAGRYAEEVFSKLGIIEQVRSKLVYGNLVRSVLGAVESGNADAGVVYVTDAKISDRVKQVATAPSNLHSPIVYPIAVIKASRNQQSARAYVQFLRNKQAQDIFKKYGFGIAN